jgi:hypothetical protein
MTKRKALRSVRTADVSEKYAILHFEDSAKKSFRNTGISADSLRNIQEVSNMFAITVCVWGVQNLGFHLKARS